MLPCNIQDYIEQGLHNMLVMSSTKVPITSRDLTHQKREVEKNKGIFLIAVLLRRGRGGGKGHAIKEKELSPRTLSSIGGTVILKKTFCGFLKDNNSIL